MGNPPSMPLRYAFLVILIAPFFISRILCSVFPFIVVIFTTISLYGFSFSYLPTNSSIYAIISTFVVAYFNFKKRLKKKAEDKIDAPGLVTLFLYVTIVDFITSGFVASITYCLIVLLLFLFIGKSNNRFIGIAFSIASLILSLSFILLREHFTTEIYLGKVSSGIERSGWTDPNYFGTVIGLGVVSSFIKLFNTKQLTLIPKVFYIATISTSIIVLILNASRGAILAVAISFMILLFFSKVRNSYKIYTLVVLLIFMYVLYDNGYFNILQYRMSLGDTTGSGRTGIWERKLDYFWNKSDSIFNVLFGYGNRGGFYLGYLQGRGFHNDFIAFLVDYGIIGLILFINVLIKPLLRKINSLRSNIVPLVVCVYIICCSLTLEPLSLGAMPYWLFFLYYYQIFNEINE